MTFGSNFQNTLEYSNTKSLHISGSTQKLVQNNCLVHIIKKHVQFFTHMAIG